MLNFVPLISLIKLSDTVLTVGLILLTFIIYQGLSETSFLNRLTGWPKSRNSRVYFSRLCGLLILGSAAAITDTTYGLKSGQFLDIISPQFISAKYWLAAGLLLILVINILTTYPDGRDKYPQLKYEHWNGTLLVINALTWLIYLFAYEWILRGPLLTECVELFGRWGGVAVNVIFYSLVHAVKGRKEMIASIPVGIILCIVTLYTGSFLPAFILHGVFAVVYENTLLYREYAGKYKAARS
jgi:membrane protease YdiL (CAAX protease family)